MKPGWVARGVAVVSVFVAFTALLFGSLMWGDQRDLAERNTHIEQCADVAESIEGFRRCVDG